MQERRVAAYTFTTEADLIEFFSQALPRKEIAAIVHTVKSAFVSRKDATAEERRLQMLKKCECELVRHVHERSTGQPSTPA